MTTYLDEIYQTDELNVEYKNNIEYCPWSLNFTSINFFLWNFIKKEIYGRRTTIFIELRTAIKSNTEISNQIFVMISLFNVISSI